MDRSQIEIAGPVNINTFNHYAETNGIEPFKPFENRMYALIVKSLHYSDLRALIYDLMDGELSLHNIYGRGSAKFALFREKLRGAKDCKVKGTSIDEYVDWLDEQTKISNKLTVECRANSRAPKPDTLEFVRTPSQGIYLAMILATPRSLLENYQVTTSASSEVWLEKKSVRAIAKIEGV